ADREQDLGRGRQQRDDPHAAHPRSQRKPMIGCVGPQARGRGGQRASGLVDRTMATDTTVLDGCSVVTMDGAHTEHASGHVIMEGPRITAVGAGPAPPGLAGATYIDAVGCLATPGLVNTHHHLYQWVTRGHAVDNTLFEWLTALYPVWACLDEDTVRA